MNDRFKFRHWDKRINKMFYPERNDNFGYYVQNSDVIETMQCTGLKDKKGKLIYENDIVKFNEEYRWNPKEVVWDEYYYSLKDTRILLSPILLCNMEIENFGLEVIGNIYENPELLEEVSE